MDVSFHFTENCHAILYSTWILQAKYKFGT